MTDAHDHPAKAELRRLLAARAPAYGFDDRAVEQLVRKARIVGSVHTIASSSDESTFVNFVVRGTVRCELVAPGLRRPVILGFLPAGEFCCLPTPAHSPYRVRAVAHGARHEQVSAVLGLWSVDAIESVIQTMAPRGVLRLLRRTWRLQCGLTTEQRWLSELCIADRIAHLVRSLSRRFGVPHPAGILVDLPLDDEALARFVGATRARVNKCINHSPALKRTLRREGREFLLVMERAASSESVGGRG